MRKIVFRFLLINVFVILFFPSHSQTARDSLLQNATLQNCVQYALKHYPLIQQALLDEQITEHEIKSRLADWFPQLSLSANYQNYFQLPSAYFNGGVVKSGTYNNSAIAINGTQNIFNRDALLASKSANDVRKQIKQTTVSDKIDLAVNVSKAFYNVLLTQKQIDLLDEDIVRLEQSLKDSYNQYVDGIVDKTDYKRATISLNNSKAQKKIYTEALKANIANLKLQMGYRDGSELQLEYDSSQMEKEAMVVDTTQTVNYNSRIEYQLLLTQKRLQQANLQYNKWSYLPAISAFGSYSPSFFSSQFSNLYNQGFPYSYAGLQLSFPIFQGTKRIQNIRVAELQINRVDLDIESAKNNISAQYALALATYKGYLNDYFALKENVDLAKDVYTTLELQYKAGVKTYLDVITAETDLRNAQSNYTNALYQVLSSKLDVQKALGTVQY